MVVSSPCMNRVVGDNSAGRADKTLKRELSRLLIRSCPPRRALVAVLARSSLVRQINWKTTQQGVSQTEGHHQRRTSKTILTRTG